MENKTLIGLFLLLAVLFNIIFYCNNWNLGVYGKPWGGSDYSRYMGFQDIRDKPHMVTVWVIDAVGWVWFPPLLFGVFLPLCLFFFFGELLDDFDKALICLAWFIFGTFNLFGYWFLGLLAQSLGACFFCVGLGLCLIAWRHESKLIGLAAFLCIIASCLIHFVFIFASCLFVLGLFIYFDLILYALVFTILGFSVFNYFHFTDFLIPFSTYGLGEPTIFRLFFEFQFPLLFVFAYFGCRNKMDWTFLGLFFITWPFVQLGRGLFFLDLLLVSYAVLGFDRVIVEHRKIVFIVFLAFMVVWFGHCYALLAQNMVMERFINGLDMKEFYESFGIAPMRDLNIPLTK
jgi:hypothetical protein